MSVTTNKLIDLERLSKFKELMDGSVDSKLANLKINISQLASTVPTVDTAEEGVLYWVPAQSDGEYEIWAKEDVNGTPTMVKNSSITINGDLDEFLTKDDAKTIYVSGASVSDDTITLSRPDDTTITLTVNNVAAAIQATNDGNGASIVDTYATKEELNTSETTANDTYLSKTDAADTYATKEELNTSETTANDTYLSKTDAADTYATKAELTAHADTAEATYQKAADITLAEDSDITALFATSTQS